MWPMPSFAPMSGTISLSPSSMSKRRVYQRAMAWRISGRPSDSG